LNLFNRLATLTRAGDWRTTLVPFVLGCVYQWLWWFGIAPGVASVRLVVLSLVTTVGFAAFGYVLNEWCDIADDARAAKPNRLAFVPPWQRATVLFAALLLALTPWAWLPSNALSWVLISAQFGCFLVYSMPFPRLKLTPPLAVLLDAAYAYVLPLWLSFHTYALFAREGYATWVFPLLGAAAVIGVRGILLHQVDDVMNDARSGILTLPRVLGPSATSWAVLVLLLVEVMLFTLFLSTMVMRSDRSLAVVLPLLYLGHVGVGLWKGRAGLSMRFLSIIPQRHLTDQFYQSSFPLAVLALLVFQHPLWCGIVPLHLLLLVSREKLGQWRTVTLQMAVSMYYGVFRRTLNASINYSIYMLFLLFGVNLKVEKTSALGYLRGRFGRRA